MDKYILVTILIIGALGIGYFFGATNQERKTKNQIDALILENEALSIDLNENTKEVNTESIGGALTNVPTQSGDTIEQLENYKRCQEIEKLAVLNEEQVELYGGFVGQSIKERRDSFVQLREQYINENNEQLRVKAAEYEPKIEELTKLYESYLLQKESCITN